MWAYSVTAAFKATTISGVHIYVKPDALNGSRDNSGIAVAKCAAAVTLRSCHWPGCLTDQRPGSALSWDAPAPLKPAVLVPAEQDCKQR